MAPQINNGVTTEQLIGGVRVKCCGFDDAGITLRTTVGTPYETKQVYSKLKSTNKPSHKCQKPNQQ
jgi:hypothetical protein